MPVTLLGRYYTILDVIKEYHHENGDVYVTGGDECYAVYTIKLTTSWSEEYKSRGCLDILAAGEFFDVACHYLRDEIKWTEPVRKFTCKYNPNKSRGCTDKNCPKKLGGPDYRYIFGNTCPYRKTCTR